MINRFFVRPILKATTWIKRNPGLALLLALILWIIPSPLTVMNWITNWAVEALNKISTGAAQLVLRLSTSFLQWMSAKSGRCFWVGFAVLPLSPLIGSSLMFWCSVQSLKPSPVLKLVEKPTKQTDPISTVPVLPQDDSDNPFNRPPFDFGLPL